MITAFLNGELTVAQLRDALEELDDDTHLMIRPFAEPAPTGLCYLLEV